MAISAMNICTLTRFCIELPEASRMAFRLSNTCLTWASRPAGIFRSSPNIIGSWPDTNIKPFALTAWE
ncbi:hypothetical protein D3C85_1584510 [compost metagenome]